MISLEVRPKLSHFDELCRQDSDAVELERMQQIYARLGLKFGKNKKSDETSINKGGKIHPSLPPNA